jgi:hypothetical protein
MITTKKLIDFDDSEILVKSFLRQQFKFGNCRAAVPNLVPAGIFTPAETFSNARLAFQETKIPYKM